MAIFVFNCYVLLFYNYSLNFIIYSYNKYKDFRPNIHSVILTHPLYLLLCLFLFDSNIFLYLTEVFSADYLITYKLTTLI